MRGKGPQLGVSWQQRATAASAPEGLPRLLRSAGKWQNVGLPELANLQPNLAWASLPYFILHPLVVMDATLAVTLAPTAATGACLIQRLFAFLFMIWVWFFNYFYHNATPCLRNLGRGSPSQPVAEGPGGHLVLLGT